MSSVTRPQAVNRIMEAALPIHRTSATMASADLPIRTHKYVLAVLLVPAAVERVGVEVHQTTAALAASQITEPAVVAIPPS